MAHGTEIQFMPSGAYIGWWICTVIQSAQGNESFSMKTEGAGDCQRGCRQDIRESADRTAGEAICVSVWWTRATHCSTWQPLYTAYIATVCTIAWLGQIDYLSLMSNCASSCLEWSRTQQQPHPRYKNASLSDIGTLGNNVGKKVVCILIIKGIIELGYNKIKSEVILRLHFPSIFSQHCGILGAYWILRRASVLGVRTLLQLNHH